MDFKKTIIFSVLFLCTLVQVMGQGIEANVNSTNANCGDNGSASVNPTGGVPPYQYEWRVGYTGPIFSTSPSVSNLKTAHYSIRITDANNDFVVDTALIQYSLKAFLNESQQAICPQDNAEVTVNTIGGQAPYNYSWSNGANTEVVSNLPGNFFITLSLTDANGCQVRFPIEGHNNYALSKSITTSLRSNIQSTTSFSPEACPLTNGVASVNPTNGTAPYQYYWNTFPIQTTQSATGLSSGNYDVRITDAQGCIANTSVYVSKSQGALNLSSSTTNESCNNQQGTINISPSGGSSPYTILWENSSTSTSRTNLSSGNYSVTVSDQNNCTITKSFYIQNQSPIYNFNTITNSSCNTDDGSISTSVGGGTPPYSYDWSNGESTPNISNLAPELFTLKITDANGCIKNSYAYVDFNDDCYNSISGKVFQDNNGNCVQESNELPILNHKVSVRSNQYGSSANTNANGVYTDYRLSADLYEVSLSDVSNMRTIKCPASGNYDVTVTGFSTNYGNNDFAMEPTALLEKAMLYDRYSSSAVRPGFNYSYYIPFKNIGTLLSDGTIEVTYSEHETFMTSSPAAISHDAVARTIRFNYANLMLGEYRNLILTFNVKAATLLGNTINHHVVLDDETGNTIESYNDRYYSFTVVGSFDPNDISVSPNGNITEEETELSYKIRFQNTGNYPAEFVIVKNVIDENLDIESISEIITSHPYQLKKREGRLFEFVFDDIQLADSNSNEAGSHGYISYKINRKTNLSLGTNIHNKVDIYFDYNEPVETNTTTNTIVATTGTFGPSAANTGKAYPNPVKSFVNFEFEKDITQIQLTTITGIVVMEKKIEHENNFQINIQQDKGLYFYKAKAQDGSIYAGKLIVE